MTATGTNMASELTNTQTAGRRRSIVRRITVGGKFTDGEAKALAKKAASRGQLLSEWAREALLAAVREQRKENENSALFVEVQALRLLLINTLEPLLRGDKMTAEQFKAMLQYVKANKRRAADEMLASYAERNADLS
jgi:hypothetical protein